MHTPGGPVPTLDALAVVLGLDPRTHKPWVLGSRPSTTTLSAAEPFVGVKPLGCSGYHLAHLSQVAISRGCAISRAAPCLRAAPTRLPAAPGACSDGGHAGSGSARSRGGRGACALR